MIIIYRIRLVIFFAIAILGCLLDLGTKNWIFAELQMPSADESNVWWFWTDLFGLQLTLNQGALFGMGQGYVPLFAFFSFLAILGILIWMFLYGAKSWFTTIVVGIITAGILGNLYDRLGFHGLHWADGTPVYAVRDWILVMIGDYPWPNFNIADSFLVVGAILLGVYVFLFTEQKPLDEKQTP